MPRKSKTSKKSADSITSQKHLRKGLTIYKTGRSPFWNIRLRDPLLGKYVVRSSKETTRLEAIEAAYEFADTYRSKANSEFAHTKAVSFENYAKLLIAAQEGKSKWAHGDNKLLNRPKDGLIAYFGKYDVTKISAGKIREYLLHLDKNRDKPLAPSTKSKHVVIIRKVLTLAVEDGLMHTLPPMPKLKTVDTPRHTFTDKEYVRFSQASFECAKRGDVVRGVKITGHHAKMFKFIVHSFLRPTEGELFGLKHKDIEGRKDPNHLEMRIRGGKTGNRVSVTMPLAVPLYKSTRDPFGEIKPDPESYVWMPEYPNRRTAINTARRLFNHILKEAGLVDPDRKLSPYSLRHYALQARLRSSHGKVNIHTLAHNAGTSVDQLERFYLKRMAPTKEMIENLQFRGKD
ncbi:tyrosine-type recombinase/integrase [Ovoidimarina sediminis]|uniref:tyrosine-type recombinase/integrase n=1 Tax=Ovoidimarina sediminis TaxID=3079856 RepID=UPI002909054D|nr:phage integrase SAM-like domain-containing protein [Rhodophyticola sp. MJ-SS7]MDU8945843.1 phage integrase SAM-like domain-containing protein [Rhodophyticola sp. MJ-SS7]